jgi:GTPase
VVDAADPTHEAQLEVTRSVLREIGADAVPSMLLLNKIDRSTRDARRSRGSTGEERTRSSCRRTIRATWPRSGETIVAFFEAGWSRRIAGRPVRQAGSCSARSTRTRGSSARSYDERGRG